MSRILSLVVVSIVALSGCASKTHVEGQVTTDNTTVSGSTDVTTKGQCKNGQCYKK